MSQSYESLQALAARITHPHYQIEVVREETERALGQFTQRLTTGYSLRVHCPHGRCTVTGLSNPWRGRHWRLSLHMTDAEVVWTAFLAIKTAEEHELRELFKFDGVAVADSHVNIHKVVDFMLDPENHHSRTAPRG